MFIQEIAIEVSENADQAKIIDALHSLIGAFSRNGQIQRTQLGPYLEGAVAKVLVATLESASLNAEFHNEWVTQRLEELASLAGKQPHIRVVGPFDLDGDDLCTCSERSALHLFTHLFNEGSPIACDTCQNQVPVYRLPLTTETRQGLLNWHETYLSFDQIQLNSAAGEKFALEQMESHTSELTLEGRSCAEAIRAETELPVYYYLHAWEEVEHGDNSVNNCPSCGQNWALQKREGIIDYKCTTCHFISTQSPNMDFGDDDDLEDDFVLLDN